jgi:prepilin-type N-terminal cleavage/methylation domain-containing protein
MRHRRCEHGFSLIELLIVVAIILVIAAIAIPSFIRSRMAANEASAVYSIKAIVISQTSYASTYPTVGFADTLKKLSTPAPGDPPTIDAAGYLDAVLACDSQPCLKSGYNFSIADVSGSPVVASFRVTAIPVQPGVTGSRGFCADPQGTITFDANGGSACTKPLQ